MATNTKKYIENQQQYNYPHIGRIIENVVQEKRWYSAALARKMGRSLKTILRCYTVQSLQTSIVWELSLAMKHNFFADIAAQLPADYTGASKDSFTQKDMEITTLQTELAAMTKERDIYRDLLKK